MGSPATKLVAVLALLVGLLVPASALAAPAVNGVFPVKSEVATNNKIVAGSDGNVWFTVSDATNDVAKITPAGQIEEFDIEGIETAVGIASDHDGNLWITDVEKAARFSPTNPTGTDKAFTVAGIGTNGQIVASADGSLWVASENQLVHFDPADPTNSVKPVSVDGAFSPKDIDVAGSLIVVADFNARIATFTADGTQVDFPLAGGSQGVAGGPNGQIAFSQAGVQPEEVGTINPPAPPQAKQIDGDPFGVALGPDGAYWIARSAAGEVIRLTTDGQITTLGGFPPKYFPRQITGGPGGTVWATMEIPGENTTAIARVTGVDPPAPNNPPPPPPPPPPPFETKIGKGPKSVVKTKKPKAKVKFRFSSSRAGATFECSLTRLKGKKTKVGAFKACKSPKAYELRPGRYRFQVRAVVGGVRDQTPAARKFKIVRIR